MLTFEKFRGINNVQPSQRLGDDELVTALNVDVGLSGELKRREGYGRLLLTEHRNVHQAKGFLLATAGGGNLTAMDAAGGSRITLYVGISHARIWYCNLPDGRTTFSNGLINGITDGTLIGTRSWGVPIPATVGAVTSVAGDLFPGKYQYSLTYVRLSDGLESGPVDSAPVDLLDGGILLTGLPMLAGHRINVYLTSHNGESSYLAGSTLTADFAYMGTNDALVLPCYTDNLEPMPAGTVTAFWRGRVLVASDSLLLASRSNQWEFYDPRRDFKQFSDPVTLIQPVDDGVWVGTETELAFLAGTEFDKLAYRQVVAGRVALGSGVAVRGELVNGGSGSAMVCIADRTLIAGFNSGNIARLSQGRYATDATEVAATFRMSDGVPQYLAVVQ